MRPEGLISKSFEAGEFFAGEKFQNRSPGHLIVLPLTHWPVPNHRLCVLDYFGKLLLGFRPDIKSLNGVSRENGPGDFSRTLVKHQETPEETRIGHFPHVRNQR